MGLSAWLAVSKMAKPAEPIHQMCLCYYNGFFLGLQVLLQIPIKYLECNVFLCSSSENCCIISSIVCSILESILEWIGTLARLETKLQPQLFLNDKSIDYFHNIINSLVYAMTKTLWKVPNTISQSQNNVFYPTNSQNPKDSSFI